MSSDTNELGISMRPALPQTSMLHPPGVVYILVASVLPLPLTHPAAAYSRPSHQHARLRHLFRVLKGCIKAFIIRFYSIFYSLTL